MRNSPLSDSSVEVRVMLHSRLLRAEGSSHGKRGVLCNA